MTWTEARLEERFTQVDDRLDRVEEAVVAVKTELHEHTNLLRGEIGSATKELRAELKTEIHALRRELKGEMDGLRMEVRGDIKTLRTEMQAGFGEIRQGIESVHVMMHRDHIVMIGALIAFIGTILFKI